MKWKAKSQILRMMAVGSSLLFAPYLYASAFQSWDQNASGTGDYHAGYAAEAQNATTEFYNPAGMVRIPQQQMVLGIAELTTDKKFKGTVDVTLAGSALRTDGGTAQGGATNFLPYFHYVAPLGRGFYIGLGASSPFHLESNWKVGSVVQYAATQTKIHTKNYNLNLGFALNHLLSLGFGVDWERVAVQFDDVAAGTTTATDLLREKWGNDWSQGWNGGILLQFNDKSRLGLSYRSPVRFDIKNLRSRDTNVSSGMITTPEQRRGTLAITMPATSSLSYFQTINQHWDVLASAMFTQWNAIRSLVLMNLSSAGSTSTTTYQENFHNTWNVSLGAHYKVNKKWLLRFGVGYDQTPTNNTDRNLRIPDPKAYAVALGAHFQATHYLGFDAGWTHIFPTKKASIGMTERAGRSPLNEETTVTGKVKNDKDVLGLQLIYDFT